MVVLLYLRYANILTQKMNSLGSWQSVVMRSKEEALADVHRAVDVMIVEENTRDAVLVETFSFVRLLPLALVIQLGARGEFSLIEQEQISKSKLVLPRYHFCLQ